ncbi:hypothetical protein AZF08_21830, partial [Bacillus gaemokensis]|uniref:hypothetical protein n=1 Tax=Bacillus gaemokensis TaxID=574375 RepID=UPI000799C78B
MPIIPNFPENLDHEHHAWHEPEAHPTLPTRRILPPNRDAGLEFLQFHRDFLVRFHQWYDSQPFADHNAVAPWTSIPSELKVASAGWNSGWEDAERRILTNNPPFASADELGLFIELGIHNRFLHRASSIVYNEPIVGRPINAPKSTLFYKIHGLVDFWWISWERTRSSRASSGGIAATTRMPNTFELWWIGANGSVQGAYWYEGGGRETYELAPAGSASTNGGIAAVSRRPNTFELWWIGANGSVQGAYWYEGMARRESYELAPVGSASTNGGIAAVSRMPNTFELWWIGANGSVQGAYWYEGMARRESYELAPAGSTSTNGGIAAVSRGPNTFELWWIGANGSVQGAYWYEGMTRRESYELAPAGSASTNGGIAVVSRRPNTFELWWIGANGSVQGAYWYEGMARRESYELAPA